MAEGALMFTLSSFLSTMMTPPTDSPRWGGRTAADDEANSLKKKKNSSGSSTEVQLLLKEVARCSSMRRKRMGSQISKLSRELFELRG
jgi:hypothetical protein